MNKICAIMGENPNELEFGYDEEYYTCAKMKYRLVTAIQAAISQGYDTFVSTLDEGVAMWGAEAVSIIKQLGININLVAAPTSDEQAARWHPERRERYFKLLEAADNAINVNDENFGEDYIFESAERIILLGDSKLSRLSNIISKADEKGIAVISA